MRKLSLIMILACALLLSACSKTENGQQEISPITNQTEPVPSTTQEIEDVPEPEQAPEVIPVNTVAQSNYNNDYLFLESGGWIYGRSWNEDGNSVFVKTRTDLSDWTALAKCYAIYPHLVDNYLYFVGYFDDEHGIYRMRTSGEDLQIIVSNAIWLQVVDDVMYYIDDVDHELYCCGLDGDGVFNVIDKAIYYSFVFDDMILYQDDADGETIHICDMNGENDKRINEEHSYFPVYDGEYVYYVAKEDMSSIRKVRIDGTDDQEVAAYACYNGFMAQGDYLYFVYAEDGDRLYRMKKDGTGIELVTQDKNVLYPQFFGTGLKYTVYSSGYEYVEDEYFAALDGSDKVSFSELEK